MSLAELPYPTAVKIFRDEVVRADAEKRAIVLKSGKRLRLQRFVLSCGSKSFTYGVRGADKYAYPLKTLDDAQKIRMRLAAMVAIVNRATAKPSESLLWAEEPTELNCR